MISGWFSSSMGLVGIDFGTHGVKMLQVREQGDRMQVVGASRIDVPLAPTPAKPTIVPKQLHSGAGSSTSGGSTTANSSAGSPAPAAETAHAAGPHAPQANLNNPTEASLLVEQLRSGFVAGGFSGKRCVVSLAREDVTVQSVRLPKMPDDELKQSAVWEASQRCGFDRNAMEVDFIRTGATLQSGENREEVILVAASHAAIHARLEPLLAAGLRPVAIDTAFAALVRTFSRQVRREADRNIVRAVVEVGASGSTMLILRGDQIAFCKPIAIGGNLFNQAVADHLQMEVRAAGELRAARIAASLMPSSETGSITDPATDRAVFEAVRPLIGNLVKEITLCLRYYGVTFRGHPPEQIIVTGGDGLEPKLGEMMSKACKTPVVFDDATNMLGGLVGQIQSSLNRTPGPGACWAVATGLSLRGISVRKTRNVPAEAGIGMQGAAA